MSWGYTNIQTMAISTWVWSQNRHDSEAVVSCQVSSETLFSWYASEWNVGRMSQSLEIKGIIDLFFFFPPSGNWLLAKEERLLIPLFPSLCVHLIYSQSVFNGRADLRIPGHKCGCPSSPSVWRGLPHLLYFAH